MLMISRDQSQLMLLIVVVIGVVVIGVVAVEVIDVVIYAGGHVQSPKRLQSAIFKQSPISTPKLYLK